MQNQGCSEVEVTWMTRVQGAASELFQIAALLLGDETGAALLVEEAVAGIAADPCVNETLARAEARERLVHAALGRLQQVRPGSLDVPADVAGDGYRSCGGVDDLLAAGVSSEQASRLIDEAARPSLRRWLEQLSPASRTVFVLRAMLGENSSVAADVLQHSIPAGAPSWTVEAVREVFRRALCSLTTSMVAAAAVPVEA